MVWKYSTNMRGANTNIQSCEFKIMNQYTTTQPRVTNPQKNTKPSVSLNPYHSMIRLFATSCEHVHSPGTSRALQIPALKQTTASLHPNLTTKVIEIKISNPGDYYGTSRNNYVLPVRNSYVIKKGYISMHIFKKSPMKGTQLKPQDDLGQSLRDPTTSNYALLKIEVSQNSPQ